MKNKWLAAFLAIFFGRWGVHRFYLRQLEVGILYVLLTVFLPFSILGFTISALLGIRDGIKLLLMSEEEFNQKYNNIHFRDRYGNRRKYTPDQNKRNSKYILLDEDEVTTQKTGGYFEKFKKQKEANSLKQSGIKKLKEFEINEAIKDFEKSITINNEDFATHYNLACAYSLNENAVEAFKHLDLAVKLGFNQGSKIQEQEELAYIRIIPVYEKFKNNRFRLTQEMVDELKMRQVNLLEVLQREKQKQADKPKSSYSILFQEFLKDENK